MRKIFLENSFVLLTTTFLVIGGFFISTPQAFAIVNLKASATVSPNTANPGQTISYTITITNDETSSANIGSVSLALDPSFTIPTDTDIIVTASRPWDPPALLGELLARGRQTVLLTNYNQPNLCSFNFLQPCPWLRVHTHGQQKHLKILD